MFFIGMTQQDFLKHNRVQLVEANQQATIYKKINYPFGAPPVTKFFYFRDGKLIQVDEGTQNPDIIVEQRHTN
jgi:hypothetical protein